MHDRLESEGDTFHESVRKHFLALAAQAPGRYLVLDGTLPADELHGAVRAALVPGGVVTT